MQPAQILGEICCTIRGPTSSTQRMTVYINLDTYESRYVILSSQVSLDLLIFPIIILRKPINTQAIQMIGIKKNISRNKSFIQTSGMHHY